MSYDKFLIKQLLSKVQLLTSSSKSTTRINRATPNPTIHIWSLNIFRSATRADPIFQLFLPRPMNAAIAIQNSSPPYRKSNAKKAHTEFSPLLCLAYIYDSFISRFPARALVNLCLINKKIQLSAAAKFCVPCQSCCIMRCVRVWMRDCRCLCPTHSMRAGNDRLKAV